MQLNPEPHGRANAKEDGGDKRRHFKFQIHSKHHADILPWFGAQ